MEETHRSINKWLDQSKHRAIANRGEVKPRKTNNEEWFKIKWFAFGPNYDLQHY